MSALACPSRSLTCSLVSFVLWSKELFRSAARCCSALIWSEMLIVVLLAIVSRQSTPRSRPGTVGSGTAGIARRYDPSPAPARTAARPPGSGRNFSAERSVVPAACPVWSVSNPAHSMTGSRGYRTSRSSQAERPHRRYAVPRRVWLSRACRQVRHSPGSAPSLAHPASEPGRPDSLIGHILGMSPPSAGLDRLHRIVLAANLTCRAPREEQPHGDQRLTGPHRAPARASRYGE